VTKGSAQRGILKAAACKEARGLFGCRGWARHERCAAGKVPFFDI